MVNNGIINRIINFDKKPSLLFIIVFACVMWTGQYYLRHLWAPDEARYTYVAQEMNNTDNWLVPQRNGKFYSHKPPLMFWLIKLGTFVTSGKFNGISGRLPSLLGGILAMWAIVMISSKWFDERTSWWSLFIISTSYLFWFKGGTGQIDMLLLGLEMIALYLLYTGDDRPAFLRFFLAFSFMGLAVLAKGPVGFIVPAGIYLFSHFASGNKKYIMKWHWLWGTFVCLLWPGIWLLLARIHHASDAYFNEILFAQNFGRFQGKFGGHYHAFYYYFKYLLIDFLPWIFFVPLGIAVIIKKKEHIKELKKLGGWIFFVLLFFSLCKGKRNLYILSVYPGFAMIVGNAISEMHSLPKKWTLSAVYPFFALIGLVAVLLIAGPFLYKIPAGTKLSAVPLKFICLPLGFFFIAGIFVLMKSLYVTAPLNQNKIDSESVNAVIDKFHKVNGHRIALSQRFFIRAVLIFIVAELYVGMVIFPAFNAVKTPVALASEVQKITSPDDRLIMYRMNGEILALYSRRRGKRINDPVTLLKEMKKTKQGIVVFRQRTWKTMPQKFHALGKIHNFTVGSGRLCWLEYGYGNDNGISSVKK